MKVVNGKLKWTKRDTVEFVVSIVSGVGGSVLCMKIFGLL